MAGFSNLGSPGFNISPPLLTKQTSPPGSLPLGVNRRRSNPSPYYNLFEQSRTYSQGGDNSNLHQANVYAGKQGIGNTGADWGSTGAGGYPQYGFSPEDYDVISRYMSNPQNQANVDAYMKIVGRMTNMTQTNPQFSQWLPEQKQNWAKDFPMQLAGGFNMIPPPILTDWGI